LDLQLPMQSVHITIEVVSLNPIHPFKVTDDDLGFFFFFFSYGIALNILNIIFRQYGQVYTTCPTSEKYNNRYLHTNVHINSILLKYF